MLFLIFMMRISRKEEFGSLLTYNFAASSAPLREKNKIMF